MPKLLLFYWETFTFECLERSTAYFLITNDRSADGVYTSYLKHHNVPHRTIWLFGMQRAQHELPCAYIEWSNETEPRIKRLSSVGFHVEAFTRQRGYILTDVRCNMAARERLLDIASILVDVDVRLPAFLLNNPWFFQTSNRILMPFSILEEFDDENNTLTRYLSRPTLNTCMKDKLI